MKCSKEKKFNFFFFNQEKKNTILEENSFTRRPTEFSYRILEDFQYPSDIENFDNFFFFSIVINNYKKKIGGQNLVLS